MAETFRLKFEYHLGAQDDQLQFTYMFSSMEALPALKVEPMEVVIQPLKLPWHLGRGHLLLHLSSGRGKLLRTSGLLPWSQPCWRVEGVTKSLLQHQGWEEEQREWKKGGRQARR